MRREQMPHFVRIFLFFLGSKDREARRQTETHEDRPVKFVRFHAGQLDLQDACFAAR